MGSLHQFLQRSWRTLNSLRQSIPHDLLSEELKNQRNVCTHDFEEIHAKLARLLIIFDDLFSRWNKLEHGLDGLQTSLELSYVLDLVFSAGMETTNMTISITSLFPFLLHLGLFRPRVSIRFLEVVDFPF